MHPKETEKQHSILYKRKRWLSSKQHEVINSENQKSKLYIDPKAQLHIYYAGITSNISLGHTHQQHLLNI